MKIRRLKFILLSMILVLSLSYALEATITIKIGTVAPLRSPWVSVLKKLGVEWTKITNGEVKLRIYPGGIAGGEEDMVRKIRLGNLGGAVFTNIGINNISFDSNVLNLPFLFNSEDELDYILEKVTPIFEKEIEQKGFKVIAYSKAGWLYFFGKKPILYPDDLMHMKLCFSTGIRIWEEAWKKSGFHVIPVELKDLMMALQSGMIDSFYIHPLLAGSGQYFALAPQMTDLKIAPLVGGVVVSNQIWKRVPDKYKTEMLAVVDKMIADLFVETHQLEKDAIKEMKAHDLKIHSLPADAMPKWREMADKGLDILMGKAFSREIYDKVMTLLDEFRKANGKK